MKKNQKKTIAIFAFSMMCLIGTYNAVMINSESLLSGNAPFKRIDEVYGNVKVGRQLAVATDWRKVSKTEVKAPAAIVKTQSAPAQIAQVEETHEAAIQATLDLKLVEVINTKKWSQGVQASQFNGSILANNGVIENLSASLPEGLNIDIAFSEMTGNTFEYDLNGEIYTGMMYQVDHSSFMVTLTNGPLEGTRLRFAGESHPEAMQEYLAENHNVEIGNFGEEIQAQEVALEEQDAAQTQTAEAPSFNFNI